MPSPTTPRRATTALRETAEEIGLAPTHVEILGHLTDYTTVTGYRVTPVVGLVASPFELKLDDFEVAEVFEVPLAFLLDPANHQRNLLMHDGRERHYYAMPYGSYYIWGATAGMLMNFYVYLTSAPRKAPLAPRIALRPPRARRRRVARAGAAPAPASAMRRRPRRPRGDRRSATNRPIRPARPWRDALLRGRDDR